MIYHYFMFNIKKVEKEYAMEKEILSQPNILEKLIKKYVSNNEILIDLPEKISRIRLVASGSSYNCSGIGSELFKQMLKIDSDFFYSSEFALEEDDLIDEKTLYIFLSQSGETSDTLQALRKVKQKGAKTLCITNKINSTLYDSVDYKIFSDAGEEKSIASTKAVSAQLLCLYLIILKILKNNGENIEKKIRKLKELPELIQEFLNCRKKIENVAKKLSTYKNIGVLGSRTFYPLAKETALKIKETSYININAHPQGEYMHGHVAVLNSKAALISIIDNDYLLQTMRNMQKIRQDYAPYIVSIIACKESEIIENLSDTTFIINSTNKITYIMICLILSQL